ncbi:LysM peptidoglycan-binding domain-containing protein [Neobacillus niacini]|uniref:C40 family peptidase n=1 Tax=Neobacillus niacini TaxID=86668 RepID=UPI002FFFB436
MKKKVATAVVTVAILSGAYAGMASANTYSVQKGDTLSKIAKQYQTSVSDLKQWNGLSSDLIFINQTLKVANVTLLAPAPAAPAVTVTSYTVVSGDYLGKIAKQFGTTVQELKKVNGLLSDLIYVGQVLSVSAQTPIAPPQAPTTPAPPAPPTPTAPSSEYIVKSGDTLSKIGLQFAMTVLELKTVNGLTSDRIYVGQRLTVSGAGAGTTQPPQVTDFAGTLVNTAKSVIGTPYAWGGSTLSGFDCSGFIYYVANQSGKSIGRYSAAGYYSRTYYVDQPQPGDLVFFQNTYKPGISHVGIYLGDNQFIHADEKKGVSISNLGSPYYTEHFDGFKRFY